MRFIGLAPILFCSSYNYRLTRLPNDIPQVPDKLVDILEDLIAERTLTVVESRQAGE